MARKKQQPRRENATKMQGFIAGAGEIVEQDINDTIRQNFMPYAMSVILSRRSRKSTASSPRTASCSTPCIR